MQYACYNRIYNESNVLLCQRKDFHPNFIISSFCLQWHMNVGICAAGVQTTELKGKINPDFFFLLFIHCVYAIFVRVVLGVRKSKECILNNQVAYPI